MTSIALYGPSNLGKTWSTCIFAYKQFHGNVFICRNLEELKNYKEEEAIVFDDISFELTDPTLLLKLCDRDLPCSVRILKKIVTIKASVVKFFTHNEKAAFEPLLATSEQQRAIYRRLKLCQIKRRHEASKKLSEAYTLLTTNVPLTQLSQLLVS